MSAAGSTRSPEYIPALDGLRGIAVLLVLAVHSEHPISHKAWLSWGWIGVDLFFVLSGFLITRILLNARASERYFKSFYVRRILRIWPVYFSFLLFVYACARTGLVREHISGVGWASLLTFTQNFYLAFRGWDSIVIWLGPTWSLGIEEQFYLVWPWIVKRANDQMLQRICMTVLLVSPFIRAVVSQLVSRDDGPMLLTFSHFDGICMGGLLAILFSQQTISSKRSIAWIERLAIPAGLAFILIDRWSVQPYYDALKFSFLALLFGGTVALCISQSSSTISRTLEAFLGFAPLRYIGKISYCLYIIHFAAFSIAGSHFSQNLLMGIPGYSSKGWFVVADGWLLSIAIASLSWYLFESPILRLKRHFAASAESPKTLAASQS